MKKIYKTQTDIVKHGQRIFVKFWLVQLVCCFAIAHCTFAACDIQIVSAGPCLLDSTYGIPHVGDSAYAIKAVINVIGAPAHPFRFRMTLANNTNYSGYISLTNWYGAWWWYVVPMALDDPIPWSITFDPDGVSGDTNLANNSASGTFTPIPPSTAVALYGSRMMHGFGCAQLNFQPGSGTIGNLWELFSIPSTHGSQQVFSDIGPSNAAYIITSPYRIPLYQISRTNIQAGTFQDTNWFVVQLNKMSVNPGLLRTVNWSDMNTLSTNWTQWLAPDPSCESSNSQVIAFVQRSLPTNYLATMTPYDVARTLHRAVMKALTYQTPPPSEDAVVSLQTGLADCGGFSALLTACLRNVGIPARRICGFRQGDSVYHARVEFHLPGTEWILADPTDGNASDPSGAYAYSFGEVPDADSFLACDVGDSHLLPYVDSAGINAVGWYWTGGATFNSFTQISYLQPNGVLSMSHSANGSFQFNLSDAPTEGSIVLQTSTNLTAWSPVNTNSANGNLINYSFPTTNGVRRFYRANVIP